jgi:hypothetical protein
VGELAARGAGGGFEGARRAGGGVGEAVGEARAESLLGDVGEAVVGVAGESSKSGVGTSGGGVAHRGRLLEGDADAAASGVFDGLLGLVVEAVVLQAVTRHSRRGVRWAREHAPPACRVRQKDVAAVRPRGARWRAASRGCGMEKGCVCVCERRVQEVLQAKQGMCSEKVLKECVRKGTRKECFRKGTK